jgi:membrane-associated protein
MFDLVSIITAAGYIGIFGIVFAETGLLFGFFLPGDSLLFTAGILASQGVLQIYPLLLVLFLAVLIGDNTGYFLGKKLGPKIFSREESLLFKKSHLIKSHNFFERNGAKALVLARFVPVVRTFAPTLAGVGKMKYSTFFLYSIIGAALWAIGITTLGYYLGQKVPNIEVYLIPGIILIILLSISPFLYKIFTQPELRQQIYSTIKNRGK